jgi:hypothetical protein
MRSSHQLDDPSLRCYSEWIPGAAGGGPVRHNKSGENHDI